MNHTNIHRKSPRPAGPHRRLGPLRRIAAWAGALICATLCATVAGPASADTAQDILGPGRWYEAGHQRTWYGSYRSIAEDHPWAWCIDAGLATPYRKAFAGQEPERVKAPKLGYLLDAYASDDRTANHVALAAHVKLSPEVPHRHALTPKEPAKADKSWGDAQKIYDAQAADADRNAGPYTVKVSLTDDGDGTGSVRLGLISAAGERVAGYPFELTLTGASPTEHPDGGKPNTTTRPPEAAPPTGTVLPGGTTLRGDASRAGDSAEEADEPGGGPPAGETAGTSEPTAASRARLGAAAPGTVRGTTAAKEAVVPLTFSTSDDRRVTARVAVRGVPSGYVDLYRPKTAPKSTQNVVTESEDTDVAGQATLQVRVPSRPTVRTNISEDSPEPGAEVADRFEVAGLNPGQKVDVEHTLYALPSRPGASAGPPAGARKLGAVVSEDVGNGTHVSPSIRLPRDFAGWIYWSEVIAPGPMTSGWTGEHGLPEETGFVPWRPQVSTKASAAETTAPAKIHDAGHVVGARPGATITVTTTAYGPLPGEPETSETAPPDAPSLGSWTSRVKIGDDGTGTFRTPDITMAEPGYVTFVTAVRGDDTDRGWHSAFGLPEETLHLAKPAAVTPPTTPPAAPPSHTPAPPPAKDVPPVPPSTAPPALPVTGPASAARLAGLALAVLGCGVAALGASRARRR